MTCPTCHRAMTFAKQDTSTGGGKKYDRVAYKCTADDTWVTVETPQEEES